MDYKSFVNKESFKTILLHHLKSQVKTKFGQAISNKIQEYGEKEEHPSTDILTSSVSRHVLESEEFPDFLTSFLKNVRDLLSDEDKYVPKDSKYGNNSQCSSASSVNASSIDFLSPDQFQNIIASVTNGTNVEKLEALATLHRLPALEHLSQQFLWSDVEAGMHDSLSSNNLFLREQSLRLYIKMLSCPEPKVVQESYLSLIKYFLDFLLPSLYKGEDSTELNFINKCRCAVQILSILNKFLQSISTHWLRYPQLLIESITTQSLNILTVDCKNDKSFPIWLGISICDPEARWLKNIMHGHISRAALLNALEKNLDILKYSVEYCEKFFSENNSTALQDKCCDNPYLIAEITHAICFLSHLLQYCEGRKIFCQISDGKIPGSWMDVFRVVMQCVRKLCNISCFSCCVFVCDIVSKKWQYIWNANDASIQKQHLMQLLSYSFTDRECGTVNNLYLTMQCLCEIIDSCNDCLLSELNINDLIKILLMNCIELYENCDPMHITTSVMNVYNSSLILMQHILIIPSTLFLDLDFINLLRKWWVKIQRFNAEKSLISNVDAISKHGIKIVSEMDKNISNVFVQLLRKPIAIALCHETSTYEISLNVLLEKVLKDIKSNGSVCLCDLAILSNALNSDISLKSVLNRTNAFGISSIIWQLKAENDDTEDIQSIKHALEKLLPFVMCDLFSTEMSMSYNLAPELSLYSHVLLFPNNITDLVVQEEYIILALQVISLLSCSIQSLCLMQSKFKMNQLLLELQINRTDMDEKQVIDPISILVNHILVKTFFIGGPGERILPCEILEVDNFEYAWPFVREFPVPDTFYHPIIEYSHASFDLNVGLEDIFLNYINLRKPSLDFVYHLIKNSTNCIRINLHYTETLPAVTLHDANHMLHEEELSGVLLVKRYAKYLNLTLDEQDEKLQMLIKASKSLLTSETTARLDVFVCTIYLMCKGDVETAFTFLESFAKSCYSFFIWRDHLIQAAEKYPTKYLGLYNVILELCDLIVKQTFPTLFSIFQFHGILPSVIYTYWTKQCYWNFLDFHEISHFVLLNILFSGEFSLYFFVAVLKHLHSFILQHAHRKDLNAELMKKPIQGFKVCDYVDFMNELRAEFQNLISKSLLQTLEDKGM